MEKIIFDEVNLLCVPMNLSGRDYLEYAVALIINDKEYKDCITKKLYPEIAKKFNKTPSRVERAIRHAIEVSLPRLDDEFITGYFGYNPNYHFTNSEYLCMVARRVEMNPMFVKKVEKECEQ